MAALVCICFMILTGFVFYQTLKHRRIMHEKINKSDRTDSH